MQPAEVHDALDARGGSGSRDVPRGLEFGALEVALGPHGVHQVVDHVDVLDRGGDGCRIREVARDDLDVGGPRGVAQLERVAHDHTHIVAGLREPGREAPADVASGAGDEDAHDTTLGAAAVNGGGLD